MFKLADDLGLAEAHILEAADLIKLRREAKHLISTRYGSASAEALLIILQQIIDEKLKNLIIHICVHSLQDSIKLANAQHGDAAWQGPESNPR